MWKEAILEQDFLYLFFWYICLVSRCEGWHISRTKRLCLKNVYLSSNNNSFFCLLVLEWKDEAPVEIAFPGEGPVMHICLLLVLFHSLKPTFDKDVTAFLSCQDVGFLKKDILRVPDNHSQLITNNNTNVAPLFEVRNTVFLLWMTVWSQVKNSQQKLVYPTGINCCYSLIINFTL